MTDRPGTPEPLDEEFLKRDEPGYRHLAGVVRSLLGPLAASFPGSQTAVFVELDEPPDLRLDRALATCDAGGSAVDRYALGQSFPLSLRRQARGQRSRACWSLTDQAGSPVRRCARYVEVSEAGVLDVDLAPVLFVSQPAATRHDFSPEELTRIDETAKTLGLVLFGFLGKRSCARARDAKQVLEARLGAASRFLHSLRHLGGALAHLAPDEDLETAVALYTTEQIVAALDASEVILLLQSPLQTRFFMRRSGTRPEGPEVLDSPLLEKALRRSSDAWLMDDRSRRTSSGSKGPRLEDVRHFDSGQRSSFTSARVVGVGAAGLTPADEETDFREHFVVLQSGPLQRREFHGILAARRESGVFDELERVFLDASAEVIVAVLQVARKSDSGELFHQLISVMDDCVFVADRNAQVDFANKRAADVLGLAKGSNLRNAHRLLLTAWDGAFSREHDVVPGEVVPTEATKAEPIHWYSVLTSLVDNPDTGRVSGVLFVLRDVFRDRVAFRVALHEIRGSIRQVDQAMEGLLAEHPGSTRIGDCRDLCQTVDRVVRTMYDQLEPDGLKRLAREPVELVSLLARIGRRWQHQKGLKVELETPAELRLSGFGHLLESAVENIFRNVSRHALADAGDVCLQLRGEESLAKALGLALPGQIGDTLRDWCQRFPDRPWVLLDIRDNGPGVKEGDLPPGTRLGEPGASRRGGIHGTGLPFISWVAGLHGGMSLPYDRQQAGDTSSGFALAIVLAVEPGKG